MKSQTRAWLVCIVLFVLWGTLAAAPFQYFSDLIRELGGLLVETPVLPAAWKTFLVYLLFAVVLVVLLILLAKPHISSYALATIIHHLFAQPEKYIFRYHGLALHLFCLSSQNVRDYGCPTHIHYRWRFG